MTLNARTGYYVIKSMGFGLLLVFVCATLLRADARADGIIASVEQHYNGLRTLSVEFVEDYSVQGHPRPPETGKLTLRKQGKMRWDYLKPAGKVFVSDGKTVYLYTSADNKVEKVALKGTDDMRAPLAFLLGHLDIKKEFRDVTVQPDGSGWRIAAKARSERSPYSGIEMLVDSAGKVSHLGISGRDESTLNFTFSQEKPNPVVNDALFHFVIPPGAEVVDAAQYAGQDR